MKYRSIVADPPWPGKWWAGGNRKAGAATGSTRVYPASPPAYELMKLDAICSLPVSELAEEAAHLFLWVPDLHLVEGNAARVARAWGFHPGRVLIWRKANPGNGRFPKPSHESVVVCSRGSLPFRVSNVLSVQDWKQVYVNGSKVHSAKPDGFLDLVEEASPGPYLELFARRQRLGWDTWGDEALKHIEMGAALCRGSSTSS